MAAEAGGVGHRDSSKRSLAETFFSLPPALKEELSARTRKRDCLIKGFSKEDLVLLQAFGMREACDARD